MADDEDLEVVEVHVEHPGRADAERFQDADGFLDGPGGSALGKAGTVQRVDLARRLRSGTVHESSPSLARVEAEVAIGRGAAPLIMPCMASSDPAYKILFSQPRMVEDTLRGYVAPDWYGELDFSTLARMNAEYIGPELYNRIGDMLWRVGFSEGSPLGGPPLANGERPYLLVLFEFQSAVDPDMAWRMHEYVYLLQRHQRGNGTLKAEGREPPVLAVVVYNGDRPWTAADARSGPVVEGPSGPGWAGNRFRTHVVLDERGLAEGGGGPAGSGLRLHGSRRLPGTRLQLHRLPPDNRLTTLIGLETGAAEALPGLLWKAFERYAGEEEKGLREGYHARVRYSRSPHGGERLPPLAEMERVLEARRGGSEMPTLMDARAMEWEARVLERGREQGREQALAELERTLDAGREGGEAQTLMDARAMEWEARVLERGREQGREQGIAQGRAEERALLRRQTERRFGAETARQVSELLAEVADAEDLLEAGDWILECRTGGELLDRLRHAHGE